MEPSAEELGELLQRYHVVRNRVEELSAALPVDSGPIKLVAVSKTKPTACIMELYKAGHRDFGENYVQELTSKAAELPVDINWHFIGHLQSGKAKGLVRDIPHLAVVETVDTEKVASKLNAAVEQIGRPPLNVFVQVCTSDEETKSGVSPADASALCEFIHRSCPHLVLKGLMTIGAPGDSGCFDALRRCRDSVSEHLQIPTNALELSMGMSSDFEEAISRGSTSVRVGSTIFGARDYSKKEESTTGAVSTATDAK